MAAWLVIGFFLVLGLAILAVAMRSGRRPPRPRPGGRLGRGTTLGVAATVLVFGVALPAYVLIYNTETHAREAVGGVELTATQQEGREYFQRLCATCHTLADAGAVGQVGPSLDGLRPSRGLTLNAIDEGRARGQGQMPADLVDGAAARAVADYVAAVAGR